MDQQSTLKQVITEPLWHEMPLDEVQTALASRNTAGLSHQEALRRLEQAGANLLKEAQRASLLEEIWETVREPMQLLLLATGVLYAVFGDLEETLTIFMVILFVIATEVVNETRAKRFLPRPSSQAMCCCCRQDDGSPPMGGCWKPPRSPSMNPP